MSTQSPTIHHTEALGVTLSQISSIAIRYAMVVVFLWFGGLKFSAYEANAIAGLAANSPFLAWLHAGLGVQAFSNMIGLTEITAGILIALHPFSPKLGVLGAAIASATFLVTISFLFSTPGVVEASAGGFPILSVLPGQFLLKDLVLFAVSVWLLAGSLQKIR
jgi:reactive chlorine resistance protein C